MNTDKGPGRYSLAVAVALALAGICLILAAAPRGERVIALTGGRIYTSAQNTPIENGVIVIRGSKVVEAGPASQAKVPAGAERIDCKGLTITPGFWNSHVHFTEPKWLRAAQLPREQAEAQLRDMLLQWGFTTVVDTASFLDNTNALRRRIDTEEIAGPRILTAGIPVYPPDGVPYYVRETLPPEILRQLTPPDTPEKAAQLVNDDIEHGADVIKMFTGSWVTKDKVLPMPMDNAIAVVRAAHQAGKLVMVHPTNVPGLEIAIESHADILAHAVNETRGLNEAHLARMKSSDMALVPTLKLFNGAADVVQEVGDYARLGGRIMFGTDVGYLTDYNPADEYRFMKAAGLSPAAILESLTAAPAQLFDSSRYAGRLAPGLAADLVVLAQDPAQDIAAFTSVRYTIRAGRILYSSRK